MATGSCDRWDILCHFPTGSSPQASVIRALVVQITISSCDRKVTVLRDARNNANLDPYPSAYVAFKSLEVLKSIITLAYLF